MSSDLPYVVKILLQWDGSEALGRRGLFLRGLEASRCEVPCFICAAPRHCSSVQDARCWMLIDGVRIIGPLIDTCHEISLLADSMGWSPRRKFLCSYLQESAALEWVRQEVMKGSDTSEVDIPCRILRRLKRDGGNRCVKV